MEGSLIFLLIISKIIGSLIISVIIASVSNKKFEDILPKVFIVLACILGLFSFTLTYVIFFGIPLFILFKLVNPSQKKHKDISDKKLQQIKKLQQKLANNEITEEQFNKIIKHPNSDLLIQIESLNDELKLLQQSYNKKLLTKTEYEKKQTFITNKINYIQKEVKDINQNIESKKLLEDKILHLEKLYKENLLTKEEYKQKITKLKNQ